LYKTDKNGVFIGAP